MAAPREVSKILTPNDLGITGTHQAGIAIPKDADVLAFFPRLDPTEYNPDCLIAVHTPATGDYWQLRFVYYNSKTHGQGTRNEYRLTGTTQMLRDLAPRVGDSISFLRNPLGDIEACIRLQDDPVPLPATERVLKNGWRLTISDTKD
ncbi:EcoRII N-terminal effector-binding domain-containing protein [Pedococcus bigeumensis]|uniref:EcoRII N-terminal effector-binding domain-containing protein n=1 Tax=Pedococcus bigeumensis TaxID=433644 RepID=UPI002FE97238